MTQPTTISGEPVGSMLDLLGGFVDQLRQAGLPVSLTENLDAMEAVQHIPIENRAAFKYALGTTLVKNEAHWRSFETVFEVYFALRSPDYKLADGDQTAVDEMWRDAQDDAGEQGAGGGEGGMDSLTQEEIAEMLMQALLKGDQTAMKSLAQQAVKRYAGMEPGRPVGGTYYLFRTLRNLDFENMMERLRAASQNAELACGESVDSDEPGALDQMLRDDEYEQRLEDFKAEVEAEIRRRLVADRGVEAMAKTLRKPLPEDVEFMHASRDEMKGLKKALEPLTRKLAARLTRKRKHGRRGPLDFRNTVRHSLATGGVPIDPKFKLPKVSKPELVVVADISGSVAAFARFTLMLVYAIQGQFSKVRSFVFIDGIDEVTDYFKGTEDIAEAIHRVNTEADVVWVDGHSDYGNAFGAFWERYQDSIGPKTTVLLLGDARNNYHMTNAWVVKEMRHKARHVYWLNPEPKTYWDTGDSVVGDYAVHCDGVYECRNLRQLEAFVEKLA